VERPTPDHDDILVPIAGAPQRMGAVKRHREGSPQFIIGPKWLWPMIKLSLILGYGSMRFWRLKTAAFIIMSVLTLIL